MRRWVALAVVLGGLVVGLAWAVGRETSFATPVATRAVEVREVATIEAEAPTGSTVVLRGRVIDAATREEIRLGQVVIESERGAMRFDSWFVVSFPTMRPVTITTWAPGYERRQELFKAHYSRDVTLTVEIPLRMEDGEGRGGRD